MFQELGAGPQWAGGDILSFLPGAGENRHRMGWVVGLGSGGGAASAETDRANCF